MVRSNTKCPVPLEQRPENEYKSLKKLAGFSWATSNRPTFVKTGILILFLTYAISSILMVSSYSYDQSTKQFLLYIPILGNIFSISILLRCYLGWEYVYKRLMQASVSYEESGWYDGQVWVKSNERLVQDRLIGIYELLPILKRLKLTIIIITALTLNFMCTINFILK